MNIETIRQRHDRLIVTTYGTSGGSSSDQRAALVWAVEQGRGEEKYSPSIIAQWRRDNNNNA